MSELVTDSKGYSLPVGTRVLTTGSKIWGTVVSKRDIRYVQKFPGGSSEYIPVVHDDEYVNGYQEHHFIQTKLVDYEIADKQGPSYKEVIKDSSVQAIVRMILMEIDWAIKEYDEEDSVFGLKIRELISSYENDMSNV